MRVIGASKPMAGGKYYIDVYAVNVATNASSSYVGTSVRAPRRRSSSKSSGRLVNGRSARVTLKSSRPEKTLKYRVTDGAATSLNIYLRSCEVPPRAAVRVQLEREADGEILATGVVERSFEKAVSVQSVVAGSYRIKMSTADGRTPPRRRRYRWTVLASTDHRSPYPRLPADARVRLVASDCRSATVTWSLPTEVTSSESPQRHCVYVEPVTTSGAAPPLNACANPRRRRKSVMVSCHVTGNEYGRRAEERRGNGTMTKVISGMKPGRRYIVDVYASTATTKKMKEFLVYERLTVDVPGAC